jgi:hypothetical protein
MRGSDEAGVVGYNVQTTVDTEHHLIVAPPRWRFAFSPLTRVINIVGVAKLMEAITA